MENYFNLVSKEFEIRLNQIRQFIKNHNPSIGSFNEEILRKFLRDFLPKWVSVGQGFIMNQSGEMSHQIDILIYNSVFYAPLYSVNDLVVIQPESVIIAIEVKTKINQNIFHEIIPKTKAIKILNSKIESQVFIYNPPSAKKTIDYLNCFNFSKYSEEQLIDSIYGLNKFFLSKSNIITENNEGVGYLNEIYKYTKSGENAVFEVFYYDIYKIIEKRINFDLKKGIDNVWIVSNDAVEVKGRMRYSKAGISKVEFGNILISQKLK